jgi:hypothetical protein
MARLKTFYTADEITNNLYTSGSEFMTDDRVEYIGAYHAYTTGERYTNSVWNNKISKRLLPLINYNTATAQYRLLKPDINVQYQTPYASSPTVTKADITNGYITRYFIQRINDPTVLEINQSTYEKWSANTIDKKMHVATQLQWFITGNIEDITMRGVFIPGSMSKNKEAISNASLVIPDLSLILTNLTEFYTDTDYSVPIDINGLDS